MHTQNTKTKLVASTPRDKRCTYAALKAVIASEISFMASKPPQPHTLFQLRYILRIIYFQIIMFLFQTRTCKLGTLNTVSRPQVG